MNPLQTEPSASPQWSDEPNQRPTLDDNTMTLEPLKSGVNYVQSMGNMLRATRGADHIRRMKMRDEYATIYRGLQYANSETEADFLVYFLEHRAVAWLHPAAGLTVPPAAYLYLRLTDSNIPQLSVFGYITIVTSVLWIVGVGLMIHLSAVRDRLRGGSKTTTQQLDNGSDVQANSVCEQQPFLSESDNGQRIAIRRNAVLFERVCCMLHVVISLFNVGIFLGGPSSSEITGEEALGFHLVCIFSLTNSCQLLPLRPLVLLPLLCIFYYLAQLAVYFVPGRPLFRWDVFAAFAIVNGVFCTASFAYQVMIVSRRRQEFEVQQMYVAETRQTQHVKAQTERMLVKQIPLQLVSTLDNHSAADRNTATVCVYCCIGVRRFADWAAPQRGGCR